MNILQSSFIHDRVFRLLEYGSFVTRSALDMDTNFTLEQIIKAKSEDKKRSMPFATWAIGQSYGSNVNTVQYDAYVQGLTDLRDQYFLPDYEIVYSFRLRTLWDHNDSYMSLFYKGTDGQNFTSPAAARSGAHAWRERNSNGIYDEGEGSVTNFPNSGKEIVIEKIWVKKE